MFSCSTNEIDSESEKWIMVSVFDVLFENLVGILTFSEGVCSESIYMDGA